LLFPWAFGLSFYINPFKVITVKKLKPYKTKELLFSGSGASN
jgi:hypothetical protein